MRITPKSFEVRVPRFVGLMAVDARETAEADGLTLVAPDRPDLRLAAVDHVVRQYPPPGVKVPRGAAVTVWFESGDDGGAELSGRSGSCRWGPALRCRSRP
ncbi:PASTA domain-containing protein, partial [Streptomyces scabiei]|uniref:PASTA domain-containing protein n=1 Tax=Streptomyces scabiei TaxID=1930 RepID=UPI000A78C4B4